MDKIKVYLAGSCSSEDRTYMCRIAAYLRTWNELDVYCPFEFKVEDAWSMSQERWADCVFHADISAIDECDVFLMISTGRESTAGTNWEQGYAWGTQKDVIVVQITDANTSLMTFCGCDEFYNVPHKKDLTLQLHDIVENSILRYNGPQSKVCTTVLT